MRPSHPLPPLRVLAVAGSLRRDSWNRRLLDAAAECAAPGMVVTVYGDLASVPLFSEDLEAEGGPEGVRRLHQATDAADGLLIATPEYNQSIPGVLKNAIDWLSRPDGESCLVGKPAAVIGATAGPRGTRLAQRELRHVLSATESLVLPTPALYLRNAAAAFDGSGRLTDPPTRETLTRLLAAFAEWIRWSAGNAGSSSASASGSGGTGAARGRPSPMPAC